MKWKKYVRSILVFLFTIIGIIGGVYLGLKFVRFFMPFVIGWMIALIANPLVRFLEKKLKVSRKHTSMLLIVLVLAVIIGGIYLIGAKTVQGTKSLIEQVPEIYSDIQQDLNDAGENLEMFVSDMPDEVQTEIQKVQDAIGSALGTAVGKISAFTANYASDIAKSLPSVLINIVFTILSAYFFIADRDWILEFGRKNIPQFIQKKWRMLSDNLKKVFGGYFKAQMKIMGVVWLILCVGLLILRVNFAVPIAMLIAILDMLPFFGTGTALIPWALFKVLTGDLQYAVGLIILYLVTQLVRRLIEPKMVGDSIGINPLTTLIFMYIGYRFGGVFGMILGVPIGAIVIDFYMLGVFDKTLKGMKEAIDDFLKWLYADRGNKEKSEKQE